MGDCYAFKIGKKYKKEKVSEIEKFVADGNYCYACFYDGRKHHVTKCIKYFQNHPFFAPHFVRINLELLVRENDIDEFGTEEGILMKNKKVYHTKNKYLAELKRRNGLGQQFSQSKNKSTQKK